MFYCFLRRKQKALDEFRIWPIFLKWITRQFIFRWNFWYWDELSFYFGANEVSFHAISSLFLIVYINSSSCSRFFISSFKLARCLFLKLFLNKLSLDQQVFPAWWLLILVFDQISLLIVMFYSLLTIKLHLSL